MPISNSAAGLSVRRLNTIAAAGRQGGMTDRLERLRGFPYPSVGIRLDDMPH